MMSSEIKIVIDAFFEWAEINQSNGKSPLHYQAIIGLLFLLRYRRGTEELIAPDNATKLCGWIVDAIEEQIEQKNIKLKFYQAVLTLLYLFRIRRVHPTFLAPDSMEAIELEGKLKKIAEKGKRHSGNQQTSEKIQDAVDTITGYINYKPDHSIIAAFSENIDDG